MPAQGCTASKSGRLRASTHQTLFLFLHTGQAGLSKPTLGIPIIRKQHKEATIGCNGWITLALHTRATMVGTGETARRLNSMAPLPEDLGSYPGAHMALTIVCDCSFRQSVNLLTSVGTAHTRCTDTQAGKHHKYKIKYFLKDHCSLSFFLSQNFPWKRQHEQGGSVSVSSGKTGFIQGDTPSQPCTFSNPWSPFHFKAPTKATGSNRCHSGRYQIWLWPTQISNRGVPRPRHGLTPA